jgi:surfactin synthase thioesterase subunit
LGALLYLAGVTHAGGDAARFKRWDAGVAGRINLRELP